MLPLLHQSGDHGAPAATRPAGVAVSADPAPELPDAAPHAGGPGARPARAARSTTRRRCSRWPWPSSTPAATTPPRWRTCRARPGSPSRRSTTTSAARRTCCGPPWTGRWTGCSPSWPSGTRSTGRAVDRLRYIVRRQVEVLQAELPYVTLLLRVRGNTETERWALDRRRDLRRRDRRAGPGGGRRPGQVRADVDPAVAARLISGTVNSIVEWYRPGRPAPPACPRTSSRGLRGRPAARLAARRARTAASHTFWPVTEVARVTRPRPVRRWCGAGLRAGSVRHHQTNEHSVRGGVRDHCRAGPPGRSPRSSRRRSPRTSGSSRGTGCPRPTARR